jgi:hypothetical protein
MKLTVGDLRKLIEGQPDEAEVLLQMQDGCCGETLDLECADTRSSFQSVSPCAGYVVVEVNAVPGYRSCIQSGGTKMNDERYWRRDKTFVDQILSGTPASLEHEKQEWARKNSKLPLHEYLGFTTEEWTAYNQGADLGSLLSKRSDLKKLEEAHKLKTFKLSAFKLRIRNALGRGGIPFMGAEEDKLVEAVEKLVEKKILEAPPINTLKLNYLRKEAKLNRDCAKSLRKEAAAESDNEKWNAAIHMEGQAAAFEQMIGYTKGLNHRQIGIAIRKGKL